MTKEKQKINKTIISTTTGEIINNEITAKENIDIIDIQMKFLRNDKQKIKKVYKLDGKDIINQKRYFYKLYKTDWNIFKDLSIPTFKILKFFELNVDYRNNSITINDKYLNYTDMSKLCNIGLSSFKKSIKELKNINMISVERKGRMTVIYINPVYLEDSKTEKCIYEHFK